jgi:transglutaminase-like putative cysteine protease
VAASPGGGFTNPYGVDILKLHLFYLRLVCRRGFVRTECGGWEGEGILLAIKKTWIVKAVSCLFLLSLLMAQGCSSPQGPVDPGVTTDDPVRSNEPMVLTPEAPGATVWGNSRVSIDGSNLSQGYIMVNYAGDNPKVKLQITPASGVTYTYDLKAGVQDTFPLSEGSGTYSVKVFENISGTKYSQLFSVSFDAALADESLPFLYPNQYVKFTAQSRVVSLGAELALGAADELQVVDRVYNYIVDNISYDYDKAATVQKGYLPDVDDTLSAKSGICFDYAAMMSAMLRSQRIPTRLVVGYAGEVYHAWISVYLKEQGWVDIVYFDGTQWVRMDPTFAASGNNEAFIKDNSNYNQMYVY